MANRVTIVLAKDVQKYLRTMQSERIKTTQKAYPLSRCINEVIRRSMK